MQVQQQNNGYDCGVYCYAYTKRVLDKHEHLTGCYGYEEDLDMKIHDILVDGHATINPLELRKEMYGHMQEAYTQDNAAAAEASEEMRFNRDHQYNPDALYAIPSISSKDATTSIHAHATPSALPPPCGYLSEDEVVLDDSRQAASSRLEPSSESSVAPSSSVAATLITAFDRYITDAINAKKSLSELITMLLEDRRYYELIKRRGLSLTDFLNCFGKVID